MEAMDVPMVGASRGAHRCSTLCPGIIEMPLQLQCKETAPWTGSRSCCMLLTRVPGAWPATTGHWPTTTVASVAQARPRPVTFSTSCSCCSTSKGFQRRGNAPRPVRPTCQSPNCCTKSSGSLFAAGFLCCCGALGAHVSGPYITRSMPQHRSTSST